MSQTGRVSFFSVPFEFIVVREKMFYDLYVNSSNVEGKDHFVRIFPTGGVLEKTDLQVFKKKYFQMYVSEDQRDLYLRSLVRNDNVSNEKKTEIIKDSAIKYLDKLFDKNIEFSNEVLTEAVQGCRDTVESMVEVVQEYNINEIQGLIANLSFHDFYTYDHSKEQKGLCFSYLFSFK